MTQAMAEGLTTKTLDKLLEAIRLAEGPGGCRYEKGGRPCCVIGQLAYIDGVPVDTLRGWDVFTDDQSLGIGEIEPDNLAHYPMGLLENIQGLWDGYDERDESVEEVRNTMAAMARGQ